MTVARERLGEFPRRMADEEDIAHAALASFFEGVRQGRFPRLDDRRDLWQVLIMLTQRRVADLKRAVCRQKRGAGAVLGESALGECAAAECRDRAIEQVVGREPTPEFAAQAVELYGRLMERLDEPALRQVAALKIDGWSNAEIAQRMGCTTCTVERKLNLIRKLWRTEAE